MSEEVWKAILQIWVTSHVFYVAIFVVLTVAVPVYNKPTRCEVYYITYGNTTHKPQIWQKEMDKVKRKANCVNWAYSCSSSVGSCRAAFAICRTSRHNHEKKNINLKCESCNQSRNKKLIPKEFC